jgi:hypothetical protein
MRGQQSGCQGASNCVAWAVEKGGGEVKFLKYLFFSAVGFLVFFELLSVFFRYEETNSNSFRQETEAREWYEGGTLHQGTVHVWGEAKLRNRIATSADWAGATKGADDLKIIRARGREVMLCVDRATNGIKEIQRQKVSTFAAVCMMQMGYKIK